MVLKWSKKTYLAACPKIKFKTSIENEILISVVGCRTDTFQTFSKHARVQETATAACAIGVVSLWFQLRVKSRILPLTR